MWSPAWQSIKSGFQRCSGAQHKLCGVPCLQTIGVASIPLEEAEFIQFPGRAVPLSVDLMRPEAAGIMKMVGGVGKGVQGVGKGGHRGLQGLTSSICDMCRQGRVGSCKSVAVYQWWRVSTQSAWQQIQIASAKSSSYGLRDQA